MFGVKNCEVYENTFKITAADGNNEYKNEDYSTNAIRMTDYGARPGAPNGVWGNRIHHNTFHITGKYYGTYRGNIPVATAIFSSVGAGKNHVYENTITIDHQAPNTPAMACAYYASGPNCGEFYRNTVTSNVPPIWIGTFYGSGRNAVIRENTIIKAENAADDFKPFRLGYGNNTAKGIKFVRNKFVGCEFGVQSAGRGNEYTREP